MTLLHFQCLLIFLKYKLVLQYVFTGWGEWRWKKEYLQIKETHSWTSVRWERQVNASFPQRSLMVQTSARLELTCSDGFSLPKSKWIQMQSLMYDMLSEVQSCRGELDSHIHTLEKHVEELREGFKSLMPLLSSTLSTQNSSIRHLLREREVKTDSATGGADR